MSQKNRRYTLKSKESKQLLAKASEKLKMDLESTFGAKVDVEIVEADFGGLLLVDGKPVLFKQGEEVLPTLVSAEILARLPKVVVDMGAVRFVCNGADVMAPGIRRIEINPAKGSLVVVVDEKYGKPLALGEMLIDADEARAAKQGPVVKNKHYVSDRVWNAAKALAE
jgi:PUA-domain protein